MANSARKGVWSFDNLSITAWLIIANTIIFISIGLLSSVYPNLINYLALKPADILQGKNLWTLITHMFMHGSFAHLFFNMFSLFFIGSFVEKLIGKKRYLWFYLAFGLFAGLFFSLISGLFGFGTGARIFGSPDIAGVGASGALFGLLGLLAVILPKGKVYLIAGPLIAIVFQAGLGNFVTNSAVLSILSFLVSIYIIISIFAIFSFNPRTRKLAVPIEMSFWILPFIAIVPLVIIGLFVDLPIGNMAHLGGLIAGLVYGIYLRKKYKRKIAVLQRYFK